jgi:membrane-associated phospholipid phosphatase
MAVLVSLLGPDQWIARGAWQLLRSSDFLQRSSADIPDLLFLLVCSSSCILLGTYFMLRRKGVSNETTRFSLIGGSAIPFAYVFKWILKPVFGRTNTRVWLADRMEDGFHWFQGGGDCSGFPSGHMTVFAAFFTAVWIFYPRYRRVCTGLTLLLAAALIATGYHFLSDVIAGAYLGLLAACLIRAFRET